jgi:hypothetical protein
VKQLEVHLNRIDALRKEIPALVVGESSPKKSIR